MLGIETAITGTLIASGAVFAFHAMCVTPRENLISLLMIKFLPFVLTIANLGLVVKRLLV